MLNPTLIQQFHSAPHDNEVLICNNCKLFWISPKDRCTCGCTTLTVTHESNRSLVEHPTEKMVKVSDVVAWVDMNWSINDNGYVSVDAKQLKQYLNELE